MFILDKDIAGGSMRLGDSSSSSGAYGSTYLRVNSITTITEQTSYVSGDGYEAPWMFNSSSSGITWNRMADGVLVEAKDLGLNMYLNVITQSEDGPNIEMTELSETSIYKYPSGYIPEYYTPNCTISGGNYTVSVMYLGNDQSDWNTSDYNKYIVASGYSNWNLNKTLTSNRTDAYYATWAVFTASGNFDTTTSSTTRSTVRLIAKPSGTVPTITPIETDLGVITEPVSVVLQIVGSPAVTVSYDGESPEVLSPGVGNVTLDLSSKWSSLSYGSHEVIVRTSQNGYECGARVTFVKSSSLVMVTTNAHSSANRPLICRLVDDITATSGAIVSRSVTNNANDANPVWEPYTTEPHVFSNETKTSSTWGLAARISIDNSDGTGNAEIKNAIALGVLYEQE